jgi:hypothetical protein
VVGTLNGHLVTAIVDTGADVNVISGSYATALDFEMFPDHEATELVFIDGSSVPVRGIVHDVAWRYGQTSQKGQRPLADVQTVRSAKPPSDWTFGTNATHSDTFMCDFYVVQQLAVPLILSANMLFGTSAFIACNEHITHWNNSTLVRGHESFPEVAVVRKRGWLKKKMRIGGLLTAVSITMSLLYSQLTITLGAQVSATSSTLSSNDEVRRQLKEEERISHLPLLEQDAARRVKDVQRQK